VIQPVAEAAGILHAAGGWLHVDAVQAAGKTPIGAYALGADTLSISAHKLGGPAGSGALVVCCGLDLSRRINGGGQERGRRGGTENLSGILGFGAAAQAAARDLDKMTAQAAWRDAAAERMKHEAGAVILGEASPRLANTLCFAAPGYSSELQVMALDLAGVMISSGAACSSGKVKASHVVEAMGRSELATCAIRVSGGWGTTESDWNGFAEAWLAAHARHAARVNPTLKEAV
jgi:cysteine desulfurase